MMLFCPWPSGAFSNFEFTLMTCTTASKIENKRKFGIYMKRMAQDGSMLLHAEYASIAQ